MLQHLKNSFSDLRNLGLEPRLSKSDLRLGKGSCCFSTYYQTRLVDTVETLVTQVGDRKLTTYSNLHITRIGSKHGMVMGKCICGIH